MYLNYIVLFIHVCTLMLSKYQLKLATNMLAYNSGMIVILIGYVTL